jgi:hypothetical protein
VSGLILDKFRDTCGWASKYFCVSVSHHHLQWPPGANTYEPHPVLDIRRNMDPVNSVGYSGAVHVADLSCMAYRFFRGAQVADTRTKRIESRGGPGMFSGAVRGCRGSLSFALSIVPVLLHALAAPIRPSPAEWGRIEAATLAAFQRRTAVATVPAATGPAATASAASQLVVCIPAETALLAVAEPAVPAAETSLRRYTRSIGATPTREDYMSFEKAVVRRKTIELPDVWAFARA